MRCEACRLGLLHTHCAICSRALDPGEACRVCERDPLGAWLGAVVMLLGILAWGAVGYWLAPEAAWNVLEAPAAAVAAPR